MEKSHTIRIDKEVYEFLRFCKDSPKESINSVIRKLLVEEEKEKDAPRRK